jgi:hypothetical protein
MKYASILLGIREAYILERSHLGYKIQEWLHICSLKTTVLLVYQSDAECRSKGLHSNTDHTVSATW